MKIHPLLYEVLREASGKTVGGMDTLSREFCRWQGAGCPVVEEEPTMSGLMQEAEQAETKERLRARIRELEAKLAKVMKHSHVWHDGAMLCSRCDQRADEIRNAALEEAAKACWPHQQFNPESGSETLLMQTASRIRALKKEAG